MSKIIPANPGAGFQEVRSEVLDAVVGVLDGGHYILGGKVEAFEGAFSDWMGGGGCVGVANGTDALELCLRASGVGEGDVVALPTHTAVATATAVVRAGAVPLLIDIEAETFHLDTGKLEEAIGGMAEGNRVAAVIPVHLYGRACDMGQLGELAGRYGFKIIEDCAQAHGAVWGDDKVGRHGDAAAFSCYPTKNLGALGDAGIAFSRDAGTAERIRHLRQYGWRTRYVSDEVGMNSRLDEIQAAILGVYLGRLDGWNARRREIAGRYRSGLTETPLRLPAPAGSSEGHVYHQFTVRSESRDQLLDHLNAQEIYPSILYPKPVHQQPAYLEVAERFPLCREVSETVCGDLLCLPIYPQLTDEAVESVIKGVRSFFT